ncbi:hypothetical protein [Tenacibaculum sp. M341]|uniref:hypothetical protein n=1 Tax=Tenacibaculum sp. M341 TaxID=2530339 RepID=UPI00104AF93A|nr:hypothetical protein [Tenacibaculum sp. M341]TCI93567.1 hypothetical protein EYW44_03930 [Tenacibaculum sp. M341]
MSITVINETLGPIKVSVNKWTDGGETKSYVIPIEKTESWTRKDNNRGVIMYVEDCPNNNGPWYIKSDTTIRFHDNGEYTHKGTAIKI